MHNSGNTTAEHVAKAREIANGAKRDIGARSHIDVLACGTPVVLGPDRDIEGTVIDVGVRSGVVQYRVAWWSGRERKTEWLEACEVHCADDAGVLRIGFRSQ